ncbi:AAA family ATPase [Luteipulveratus sp. YIM 133132]|uniref:AAA family ATPase n=1 Tax=Luteipulveratus flavus TaxID=3031728 RepID=UPI0023B11A73|nr:AAA family ATPase [Luteipulveratus sp. YIM 133132]MDE9364978.1 AAA family ATPase [Luteipulveratus sp. YIM 133132]
MSAPAFEHGLVLGKFYPLHAGHQALIRQATAVCERVTVQVHASQVESIPLQERMAWVRAEHPTVRVVGAYDEGEVDFDSAAAWDQHMTVIEALLNAPVDAVLTSDAYGAELARRLDAQWMQCDPGRVATPVSGTAVRADVAGHWWALSAPVRASFARRVVVVGAESTGTTTLSRALAEHYGTTWVPEFGREWTLLRAGGPEAPWHTGEFDLVAREQSAQEDRAAATAPRPLIVCDTDALATTLWHERYVGSRSTSVEAYAAGRRTPDLYLLTGDEIPFVQDGMRDGEHVRGWMQERFREVLAAQAVPWQEVRGSHAERMGAAVAAVDALVAAGWSLKDPLG